MKRGDKVRAIGVAAQTSNIEVASSVGEVTEVVIWPGECTPDNHGMIEVKYPSGYLEHFCYYRWETCLELVENNYGT